MHVNGFSSSSTTLWVSTAAAISVGAVFGYSLGRWSLVSTWRWSGKPVQSKLHENGSGDLCMYLIILEELGGQSGLIDTACRTVLGHYKKLYRRNNPILQEWDRIQGRKKIRVFVVPESALLAEVQASARASLVPTHTFVVIDKERNKHRRAVVVGPTKDDMHQLGILKGFEEI